MEGFYIHVVDGGYTPPFEQVKLKKNNAINVGRAMIYINGYGDGLFSQIAEKAPTHISMSKRAASETDQMISAVRVTPDIEFEVESAANLDLHGKFAVSESGLTIEAVSDSAVACGVITNKEVLTNGTYKYRVRFN